MSFAVNQQDFNKTSSSTLQSVLSWLSVVMYQITKFVVGFIQEMNKMFWGK